MKFAAILFVFVLGESMASEANDKSECFKVDKRGTRFHFCCLNSQEWLIKLYTDSTLGKAMQVLNTSAVTELKISRCGVEEADWALKKFELCRKKM